MAHDQTFLEMTETDTTMIIHDEEMYFKPSFWAAGIAGLEFRIAEHLHLSLEGSMGQGFSVASKLKIGL